MTDLKLLRVGAIDFFTFLDLGAGILKAGLLYLSDGMEVLLDFLLEGVFPSVKSAIVGSFSGSGSKLPDFLLERVKLLDCLLEVVVFSVESAKVGSFSGTGLILLQMLR